MLRVIRNHAAAGQVFDRYEGLSIEPPKLDIELLPSELIRAQNDAWMDAYQTGFEAGFRNAQVSVIAPTGPSVSSWTATPPHRARLRLVKFKKLAGGGSFRIINQAVPGALSALGYGANEQAEILTYATGHGQLPLDLALKIPMEVSRASRPRSRAPSTCGGWRTGASSGSPTPRSRRPTSTLSAPRRWRARHT